MAKLESEIKLRELGGVANLMDQSVDLGAAIASPKTVAHPVGETHPYAIVPDDCSLESLGSLLVDGVPPARVKRQVLLDDENSFIDYVNDFAFPHTRLYASRKRQNVVAVIDDHESNIAPGRCVHGAMFAMEHSLEWQAWVNASGQRMGQREFALFIEENLDDVVSPANGALLNAVTTLRYQRKVDFGQAVNLQDGRVEFNYSERDIGGGDTPGQTAIPAEIQLEIPVFNGGQLYPVRAMLRYVIEDQTLCLHYKIIGGDRVLDQAFGDVCANIQERTSKRLYKGEV